MIRSLSAILTETENNDRIKMVVVRGAGEKAFCAGVLEFFVCDPESLVERSFGCFPAFLTLLVLFSLFFPLLMTYFFFFFFFIPSPPPHLSNLYFREFIWDFFGSCRR